MLIVDGKNLVTSPSLKELNEVEKDDVKKTLPTILDIVLRPELFVNATYLSEGESVKNRIISNEIKDEDDYYDDTKDEDYVIATLDELYNEVEDIYDELYDNAEPIKPQNLVKDKPTPKPVLVETLDEDESSKEDEDAVIFPSPEDTTDKTTLEYADVDGSEFLEGSGMAKDKENIEVQSDSTRIEFPRTLDIAQNDKENDVDYDYPDMDMPVANALKNADGSIELSPHNRLFPMPSMPSIIQNEDDDINRLINQQIIPRNKLHETGPDLDGGKCYCPCKCTEQHSGPITDNTQITTESSRTSAHTTGYK